MKLMTFRSVCTDETMCVHVCACAAVDARVQALTERVM